MPMTGKERASLRAEAHHLSPLVHVGHQGLTPAVFQTLDDALRTRELVKVQFARTVEVRVPEGGLTPTRALPCGGVLDVLVEYLQPGEAVQRLLDQVEQALGGGELLIREVPLGEGVSRCRPASMSEAKIQRSAEQVSIRVGAVLRVVLAGWSPAAEFCAGFPETDHR